jgi:hypothetical protein
MERADGKQQSGVSLDPTTKRWINQVIVPALLREYLAFVAVKKVLAPESEDVAACAVPAAGREGEP